MRETEKAVGKVARLLPDRQAPPCQPPHSIMSRFSLSYGGVTRAEMDQRKDIFGGKPNDTRGGTGQSEQEWCKLNENT
ncbi:hypothetical protein [Tengunoibacter tsumagoiensis]|uniref:Uncharacterized protein n=1 Tax=Tengunoibacter tsumagoiensis TaxID=2014871 RepID=A0A402A3Q3_9CHLR|nr:hypothetical protein [Tengunoibacter tsumagoiensis]GCE13665.1 hypothetical protein KTT_35240 [Tengunoibacter tsumagoiensis]